MDFSIYDSLGEEKVKALAWNFYQNVAKTPDLRLLYPKDLAPAEERMFWFLSHIFGGPPTYLEKRGHPMLRKRHFQWPIDGKLKSIWLECMHLAIDQIDMPHEVRESIIAYFANAANHLVNQ